MTQENKELLLKDLCARLPYGVILSVILKDKYDDIVNRDIKLTEHNLGYITKVSNWQEYKPYLRSMSSMTEEEEVIFEQLIKDVHYKARPSTALRLVDWLDKNMFDYRGLIKKGLAIAVTENNNPYKD